MRHHSGNGWLPCCDTVSPMRTGLLKKTGLAALIFALNGCDSKGFIELPKGDAFRQPQLPANSEVGVSGIRRLTRVELDTVLADVLGDTSNSAQRLLPTDSTDPFDN